MKKFYQIVRYDSNRNKEIVAGGVSKSIAEEALRYSEMHYKSVEWSSTPSVRATLQLECYEGVLIE